MKSEDLGSTLANQTSAVKEGLLEFDIDFVNHFPHFD